MAVKNLNYAPSQYNYARIRISNEYNSCKRPLIILLIEECTAEELNNFFKKNPELLDFNTLMIGLDLKQETYYNVDEENENKNFSAITFLGQGDEPNGYDDLLKCSESSQIKGETKTLSFKNCEVTIFVTSIEKQNLVNVADTNTLTTSESVSYYPLLANYFIQTRYKSSIENITDDFEIICTKETAALLLGLNESTIMTLTDILGSFFDAIQVSDWENNMMTALASQLTFKSDKLISKVLGSVLSAYSQSKDQKDNLIVILNKIQAAKDNGVLAKMEKLFKFLKVAFDVVDIIGLNDIVKWYALFKTEANLSKATHLILSKAGIRIVDDYIIDMSNFTHSCPDLEKGYVIKSSYFYPSLGGYNRYADLMRMLNKMNPLYGKFVDIQNSLWDAHFNSTEVKVTDAFALIADDNLITYEEFEERINADLLPLLTQNFVDNTPVMVWINKFGILAEKFRALRGVNTLFAMNFDGDQISNNIDDFRFRGGQYK